MLVFVFNVLIALTSMSVLAATPKGGISTLGSAILIVNVVLSTINVVLILLRA